MLFNNSELTGRSELVLTGTIIEALRKHKFIELNLAFENLSKYNEESGRIFFKLEMKSESLDMKYYDNNLELESCYYDPFETNEEIINEVSYRNNSNK